MQQSSDLTLRLYDYKRPGLDGKPRTLHLAQGLEVTNFATQLPGPAHWREKGEKLVECEHFVLSHHGPQRTSLSHESGDTFMALTLIAGAAQVQGPATHCVLRAGETALVPAGRQVEVLPAPECEYLIAAPGASP